MLKGKRLVITGLATTESIAFAVAERALLSGADIVLTAPGRDLERCRAAAAALPRAVDVLEADLTREDAVDALQGELRSRYDEVDGALHAVAFAPRGALDGALTDASPEGLEVAFRTSTWSLAALARATAPLFPATGGSLVGLTFHSEGAWPTYNWMGVCKSALEALNRYLARDLGATGSRANLVAAGPLHTRAAGGIPGFDKLLRAWAEQAPLAWDPHDPGPTADAVRFLLSDLARAITGEVLHVDGGFHAMATALRPAAGSEALPELERSTVT